MLINLVKCLRNYSFRVKPNKKPQVTFKNWQIVKGDTVEVRSGPDKRKVGKVLKVYRKSNQVIVEGLNLQNPRHSKLLSYI